MKYLVFLFALCFTVCSFAQESAEKEPIPRLEKREILKSGTSAYFPKIASSDFDSSYDENLSFSPDSAKVYIASCLYGNYDFSVILVQFNGNPVSTPEEKETLLISYMDFLKESFEIIGSAGYGKGHTLTDYPTAIGVIDYWTDGEENIAVKGWIVENQLAIMMLSGVEEYPYFTAQELFLNGIRF